MKIYALFALSFCCLEAQQTDSEKIIIAQNDCMIIENRVFTGKEQFFVRSNSVLKLVNCTGPVYSIEILSQATVRLVDSQLSCFDVIRHEKSLIARQGKSCLMLDNIRVKSKM